MASSSVQEPGFGFRLRAHAPAGLAYRSDDEGQRPRRYRIGERDEIRLSLVFDDENFRSTLAAVGYPYASEDGARSAGERVVQALRLAGWELRTALDLGPLQPRGTRLSDHAIEAVFGKTQDTTVGDIHGLTTFRYLGGEVYAIGSKAKTLSPRDEDEFVQLADVNLRERKSLDERASLAVDLYAQANLGSSVLGAFVTKVACLEICAEPELLGATACELVDDLMATAKALAASSMDERVRLEVNSIVSRLGSLRRESIAASIVRLAGSAGFTDADIRHVPLSVPAFVRKIYEARSRMVHAGGDPVELGAPDLASDLESLVRKLIQYRIEQSLEGL